MPSLLILGIGNALMGDEGVGIHVADYLSSRPLPPDVECLDGGTGGFTLLEPMQTADAIILVDACIDGSPPGTIRRLEPRFSRDYPRTLTAHDIGLKDLLDTFHLLNRAANVTLFAVSIELPSDLSTELTPAVAAVVPTIAEQVLEEVTQSSAQDVSTSRGAEFTAPTSIKPCSLTT
jgi:hydrogenase maturation protease